MFEESTPPDPSVWKFVAHTTVGDVETLLWHRRGSNQFGWRSVEKHWGAVRKMTEKPASDFIKILVPQLAEIEPAPLLVNDL